MLSVRTIGPPETLIPAVRNELKALDPDQAVTGIRTMNELFARSTSESRFSLWLFSLFAALAVILASIGIYGVMATSVVQRTHEIGLRMALGAQKRDVLHLIIGQAMVLVVIGMAAGLLAAFALTRLMTSMLFGVSATDPITVFESPEKLAEIYVKHLEEQVKASPTQWFNFFEYYVD